jgi:PAS domain S-box-containing protein
MLCIVNILYLTGNYVMKLDYIKFKQIRKAKKISIKSISTAMGKSTKTLWTWESGRIQPKSSDVYFLANFIGINIDEISDLRVTKSTATSMDTDNKLNTSELNPYINNLKNEINYLNILNSNYIHQNRILKNTIDNQQGFIYTKDSTLKITYINNSFCSYLKMKRHKLLGSYFSNIFDYNEVSSITELEKQVLNTGIKIINKEILIPGRTDTLFGLINIAPIFNDKGNVEFITGCILNITDIKQIKKNLQVFESVCNYSKDGIYIAQLNPVYKVIFMNQSYHNITGYTLENYIADESLWLKIIHPDDRDKELININKYPHRRSYRIIAADGKIKTLEILRDKLVTEESREIVFGIVREVLA